MSDSLKKGHEMSLKRIMVGPAVATAVMGAASIPARSMARADAYAEASAGGYHAARCRAISSSLTFENGIYDATLTLSCS